MKSLRIARELLWANRWLWLLLLLWPWVMTLLLQIGGLESPEEISAALQQEAIYGLALVAFAGGALLGNEQRSRRIVLVMSRAVSRRQYMGALWLAAELPLLAYALDLALAGLVLHVPAAALAQTLGALQLLSAVAASAAVLASLFAPGILAGILSLGLVSLLALLPAGYQIALTRLLQILTSGPVAGQRRLIFGAGTLESILLAAAIFEAAVRIFERRDLRLKME